jgi:hypothetical protein
MRLALGNPPPSVRPADPAVEAYRQARLDELDRLRGLALGRAERIGLAFDGKLGAVEVAELAGRDGLLSRFFRSERAVRQIVILEMELLGLRPAPDRDRVRDANEAAREPRAGELGAGEPGAAGCGWREGGDYDNGPYDQVVARLRRDLQTEAPANDPFAPPATRPAPEPAAPEPAAPEPVSPSAPRPGMSAKIRKIIYGPVVTPRMALLAQGDVPPIPAQGLKARYLAGEFGRGRGPPGYGPPR